MKTSKKSLRIRRKKRIKAKIYGTKKRPRLTVFKSLKHIIVQVIDDENGITICQASNIEIKQENNKNGAAAVGELIAKKCIEKKIDSVVFDRAGYKYHGKLVYLSESARKAGLKF